MVVVGGSHGGAYPGYLAAKARACAVILNDAGIGKDDAGIGCLGYCDALGMAAATVSHMSARIGDAEDTIANGIVSRVNDAARAAGCREGMSCLDAASHCATHHRPTPRPSTRKPAASPDTPRQGFVSCAWIRAPSSRKARTMDTSCSAARTEGSSPTSPVSRSRWTPPPRSSTTRASARTAPASPACRPSMHAASPPRRRRDERPNRRWSLDVRRRHREPRQRDRTDGRHRTGHAGPRGDDPHCKTNRRCLNQDLQPPDSGEVTNIRISDRLTSLPRRILSKTHGFPPSPESIRP